MYLTLMYLVNGKVKEINIDQQKKDDIKLRAKTYPVLGGIGAGIMLLLIQVGLIVLGGFTIGKNSLTDTLAVSEGIEINFSKDDAIEYKLNNIGLMDNGAILLNDIDLYVEEETITPEVIKLPIEDAEIIQPTSYSDVLEIEEEVNDLIIFDDELEITNPIEDTTLESDLDSEEIVIENLDLPVEQKEEAIIPDEEQVSQDLIENKAEVLGVRTSETRVGSIQLLNPIEYKYIISVAEIGSKPENTEIKYQISNDGLSWYYNWEGLWVETFDDEFNSNTIEDLNLNLESFEKTGEIYFRIYLIGNSNSSPILEKLVIQGDFDSILDIEIPTSSPIDLESTDELIEENISNINIDESLRNIETKIYNASFYNGEKVVRGKVTDLSDNLIGVNY
ncbi:MAG: hypothetical protein Q9M76_06685 [Candidatus Dojkabacteria bacterium]|nr:hypothetical protein [Candidatus Dojkabacteria bacterium]